MRNWKPIVTAVLVAGVLSFFVVGRKPAGSGTLAKELVPAARMGSHAAAQAGDGSQAEPLGSTSTMSVLDILKLPSSDPRKKDFILALKLRDIPGQLAADYARLFD